MHVIINSFTHQFAKHKYIRFRLYIAGLDAVPCWVRHMDDDEAYMQLALGNVQGELSPLEIGMHALRAVPLAEGGRGLKGGISACAATCSATLLRFQPVNVN